MTYQAWDVLPAVERAPFVEQAAALLYGDDALPRLQVTLARTRTPTPSPTRSPTRSPARSPTPTNPNPNPGYS